MASAGQCGKAAPIACVPDGGGNVLRAKWARTAIPGHSRYLDVPKPIRSTVATFPSVLPTRKRPGAEMLVSYSTIAEPKTVSAPSAWRGAASGARAREPRRASASGGAGEGATHTW